MMEDNTKLKRSESGKVKGERSKTALSDQQTTSSANLTQASRSASPSSPKFQPIESSKGFSPGSKLQNFKQVVSKLPRPTCFSADIVTLHPDSAVAKRIMYSKKIAKPRPSTANQLSRSKFGKKTPSAYSDPAYAKRYAYSFPASEKEGLKESTGKLLYFSPVSQTTPTSFTSDLSSASSSTTSFYWNNTISRSTPAKPSQEGSFMKLESVPVPHKMDGLVPTTRAHFKHRCLIDTWNQERLFNAVIAEINLKYSALSHFIDLRPTRQFMVGLFYTLPWKDITFEKLYQEVEKRWVQPIYQRYRSAFVTTCMLYGGTLL